MSKNKKQRKAKRTLSAVYKDCARAMWLPMALYAVSEIIAGMFNTITANVLGKFTDAAFHLNLSLGIKNAVILALSILAIVVLAPSVNLFSNFIMLKYALLHDQMVLGRYLDKEPEKALQYNCGELQYQVEDAPNTLRIYWVNLLGMTFATPVCLGYFLYSAGSINWPMTGLMLLLAAIKLLSPLLFKRKISKYDKLDRAYKAKRRAYESDAITRPCLMKLWEIQKPICGRINQLFSDYYHTTESGAITCKVFSGQLYGLADKVTQLLLFLFGAVMVAGGQITPGGFTSMLVYFAVVQTFYKNIGDVIQNYYPLMVNAANRVEELYQDRESDSGEHLDHFQSLTVEKINFSFPKPKKELFHDLSFSIKSGDKVGILGKNGSGKSTLCKIISSLIRTYSGTIRINDRNMRDVKLGDWRSLIAYASQTSHIFNTTVRENITMGNPDAKKEAVDQLMVDFGIFPLAERVVANDSVLSGGERQKISIIRALIKKSEVLILDEPSNHLDRKSVDVLKRYIKATDKAVILISHDTLLQDAVERFIHVG